MSTPLSPLPLFTLSLYNMITKEKEDGVTQLQGKYHALILQRLWQRGAVQKTEDGLAEDATVGLLTLFKQQSAGWIPVHACYTIENGGHSSEEENRDLRIMPGVYYLTMQQTTVPLPREYRGRGYLLIQPENPTFASRRIFIHAGNYPQDTKGCILLQSTYDTTENPGYGRGSMRATRVMYDYIQKYTNPGHSMPLLIKDEPAAFSWPSA